LIPNPNLFRRFCPRPKLKWCGPARFYRKSEQIDPVVQLIGTNLSRYSSLIAFISPFYQSNISLNDSIGSTVANRPQELGGRAWRFAEDRFRPGTEARMAGDPLALWETLPRDPRYAAW
jgi:hypothetical protein